MGQCCSVGVVGASESDTDAVTSSDRSSSSRVRARIVIVTANNGAPFPAGASSPLSNPTNHQRLNNGNIGNVPFFYDSPTHTSGRRTQSDDSDSVKFCTPTTTASGRIASPQRRPVSFVVDPEDTEDAAVALGTVPSYMNVLSQHAHHHCHHLPAQRPHSTGSGGGMRSGSSGGSSRHGTTTPIESRNPLVPGKDVAQAATRHNSCTLDSTSHASGLSTVTNHLGVGGHPSGPHGLPQLVDALALELGSEDMAAGGHHATHSGGIRMPAIASLARVLSVGSASSHDLRTFAVFEEPPAVSSPDGTGTEGTFGSPWVGQQPQGLQRGLGGDGVFAEPDSPARLRLPRSGSAQEQQTSIWEEGTPHDDQGDQRRPCGVPHDEAPPQAHNDLLEVPPLCEAIDNLEMF